MIRFIYIIFAVSIIMILTSCSAKKEVVIIYEKPFDSLPTLPIRGKNSGETLANILESFAIHREMLKICVKGGG